MLVLLVVLFHLSNGIKISHQFVEEPDDVESLLGSTLILHCRTESLDENQVTWCKNDFCTLGKTRDLPFYPRYEIIGDAHHGEHHFQIVNVSLEDMGIYQCQILAGARRAGSMSRKAKLTVLQIPRSLALDSPVIVVEDRPSSVVCRSQDGMPEAKLTWSLPDELRCVSKNDYVLLSGQWLRNSISNVTLLAKRSSHGQLIRCQAHSSALEISNRTLMVEQAIQVHYSPQITLKMIGDEIEGTSVIVECIVDSRPTWSKIEWFNGTFPLTSSNTHQIALPLDRFSHGNEIVCRVTNAVGTRNQSITLVTTYRPTFVNADGSTRTKNSSLILVHAGDSVQLDCFVDSYPSSRVSWRFNGKTLSFNETSLRLTDIQSHRHVGLYICHADHPLFGQFNQTIRVALKGPPEIIEDERVRSVHVGQSLSLVCSISAEIPIQDIFWSRDGHERLTADERYDIIDERNDDSVRFQLTIMKMSVSDQGSYLCNSVNAFGSSRSAFEVQVIDSRHFFVRSSLFYGSVCVGLALCLVLIVSILIFYRHQRRKPETKISTSSQERREDSSDESNSNVDQCLLNDQWTTAHRQQDLFHLTDYPRGYSTVV